MGSPGPYTYSMDGINYQTDPLFSGLGPGTYHFYYKNAMGQVGFFGFALYSSCGLSINEVITASACGQNTGSLTINAGAGIPPYTFPHGWNQLSNCQYFYRIDPRPLHGGQLRILQA